MNMVRSDSLALLFSDEVVLSEAVIPIGTPRSWSSVRLEAAAFGKVMMAAVGAGMALNEDYPDLWAFRGALRSALTTLPVWPAVEMADLEFYVSVDFNQPPALQYAYLQYMEGVHLQSLRDSSTMRTQGWGLLEFSLSPCWSVVDKFGVDQAYA